MKTLYCVCAINITFWLASCAGPRMTVQPLLTPPSVRPVVQPVSDASSKVTAAVADAKAAKDALALKVVDVATANQKIDALTQILLDAQADLKQANGNAVILQQQIDSETKSANTCIEEKNTAIENQQKAEAQDKIDKEHAHRLKLYICGAVFLLALLLVSKLPLDQLGVLLPGYGFAIALGIRLGVPLLAAGAVWMWI